ncbi:MAG: hypothetical protein H7Y00_01205 [Fimbriimonadaceae bacterium]|nr:hypothetical protein [Chitinophagales bacterium]
MKKLLPAFFILLSSTTFAQSNSKSNGSGYFGIGILAGVPIAEFGTYNEDMAIGVGLNFFYQPSDDIPVMVGLDLGFMGNGNNIQNEVIYAEIKVGETVIDEIQFPFRIETHNSIFAGHFVLRAVAPIKYFKPYVDGIVGFNNFSTNTSIYDESEEHYFSEADNPLITTASQNSDWTFSYGGAAGILVQCGESFFIDLRCAYAIGGEADYYVEDDIEDWEVEFTTTPTGTDDLNEDDIAISAIPKHSETTMLMPSLGVTFKF